MKMTLFNMTHLCLLLLTLFINTVVSQNEWWRTGVIYQIYPRSFKDGCIPACTGNGTLRGVTSKLSYLKQDLGVNILWLSPIYASPMKDFGYDISNYTDIWPGFGTMQDFDEMMVEAKKLGMKILMDFVPNHTSDQHAWFQSSKSSLDSPHRDWYIWRNGTEQDGNKIPPNNWKTMFCPDAKCYGWTYDETTDQWYYHVFLKEQPDLNWRNSEVRDAMHNVLRFWLSKGVDGFRVDAFVNILEDDAFPDEPINPDWHGDPVQDGYGQLKHIYTENYVGLHQVVRGFREVLQEYDGDRMMIGEIYADNIVTEADVVSYYGTESSPEFNMPFNMNLISFFEYTGSFDPQIHNDPRNASNLQTLVDHYNSILPSWAQPNFVLGNHDVHRIASRVKDEKLARVAHVILLTLRGTPTIYNGDEIGMTDGYVPESRRQDPNCKIDYDGVRCRDPERTPLQWDTSSSNAGFTAEGIKTWLPVSDSYKDINVKEQLSNKSSTFALVHRALKLRSSQPCLLNGNYSSYLGPTNPPSAQDNVFTFIRENGTTYLFVIINNLGTEAVDVDVSDTVDYSFTGTIMIDSLDVTKEGSKVELARVSLQPSHSVVLLVVNEPHSNPVVMGISVGLCVLLIIGFAILGFMFGRRNGSTDIQNSHDKPLLDEA